MTVNTWELWSNGKKLAVVFPKNYKKSPSCCRPLPVIHLSCTTLLNTSPILHIYTFRGLSSRAELEDTTLEAKDKYTKKSEAKDSPSEDRPSRGQGQECSRTKDTGASVLKKNFFSGNLKKKVFKIYLLVLELRSRGFYVQAYADDLAVLDTGADMIWIRNMAQKALNIAANWASEQELQCRSKKTEIVLFTHKRNPDLGSLSMNGSKLELSQEARLLGVTLDSKLTWKPHITQITRKATTALMQCGQIMGKTWKTKPFMLKWIYTAMIRPIMSYACVFWAGGLNKNYLVKKLTKVQRFASWWFHQLFLAPLLVL